MFKFLNDENARNFAIMLNLYASTFEVFMNAEEFTTEHGISAGIQLLTAFILMLQKQPHPMANTLTTFCNFYRAGETLLKVFTPFPSSFSLVENVVNGLISGYNLNELRKQAQEAKQEAPINPQPTN